MRGAGPYFKGDGRSIPLATSDLRRTEQVHFPLGDSDAGDAAAFERQEVALDAVTEDHAVMRHLRGDLQGLAGRDRATNQFGRRDAADERLADTEAQLLQLRVE